MSNQTEINETLLNTAIDLIVKKDPKKATLFLNTFALPEKDLIFTLLMEKRKTFVEAGNPEKAEKLTSFLGLELNELEKETIIKKQLVQGFYNIENITTKIKQYFPEQDNKFILQFFIDQKQWHSALKAAENFSLILPLSFVKETLQIMIKEGYLVSLKSVLDYIEKNWGIRKLTAKEKDIFLEKVKISSLKDFLDIEIFLGKNLDTKLLLHQREKAIKDGLYDQALVLSKITNKRIKTEELGQMLEKILRNYYSFTDKARQDERKRLESQLPLYFVRQEKENCLKANVSDGNLAGAKFLAAELGRELSIDEFKEIIRYFIFTENEDAMTKVIKEMKYCYPEEADKLEK